MKNPPSVAKFIGLVLLCAGLVGAFAPDAAHASQPAPYRIMAVGDSITAGYLDNPTWTLPYQFGYRNGLLTRLVNAGYPVKFVGGSPEPWNGSSGTPGNIPNPDLRVVGQDGSEGFSGKGTAFILGNMSAWLSVDQPDVMLLMIGINDIGQGSSGEPTSVEQNLNNIVTTVVSQSPNTHLIVAQITPYATYSDSIIRYNNYIANVLVPYFAGQGKYVTTVNQYTNLCVAGTTNIDPTAFANGINHPNNAAYDRMAQTWFNGIQALSLGVPQTSTANENLVVNSSFEAPQFASNSHNVNPASSTGWTFTWGGISGAGAGIDNGNAYGQGGSNSYDGSQRACLQSSGNSTVSHLSQAVSGFKVGQFYQLSFRAKGIGAFTGANPFHVSIISGSSTNVLFGGSTITPSTTGYTLYTSAPFQATNTVMTLDFADLAPGVITYVSWIDGVSINSVSGINLLANGGFEAPTYGFNTHNINPSPSYGWTFTSPASGGGGSGIDNGDPYGSNNGSSIEFAGWQQACLQGSGNSTVTSISQTVTNLTVGQYYQVSFLAKAINGFSGANPFQVKTISGTTTNVLFGGSDIVPSASGYTFYTSAPFQATNSSMTLMFADHGLSSVTYVSWLDNVALYAVSPWEQWRSANFNSTELADPNISKENGDPDHDGIKNLMEYALNGDPHVNNISILPTQNIQNISGTSYLTLTYRHHITSTDITYNVQVSGDLITWTTLAPNTYEVGSPIPIDSATESITFRDNVSSNGQQKRFMRLNVTKP
jgi:lysophospholipase L1-like esterase